jgi:hypothetical protein
MCYLFGRLCTEGACLCTDFQETKTEGSVEEMHAKRMEEETDPVSTQALNAGLAHFKEGRLEEGREMFQQAIAADNFNFQVGLGWSLAFILKTEGRCAFC